MRQEIIMTAITKKIAANRDALRIIPIPGGVGYQKIDRPNDTANVIATSAAAAIIGDSLLTTELANEWTWR